MSFAGNRVSHQDRFIYFERVDHRHYIVVEAVRRIIRRQITGRAVSAPGDTVNMPAGSELWCEVVK